MAAMVNGAEDLEKRVTELEESLTAALARLEIATRRERRWRRENQELRAQLRENGHEWVEGQADKEGEPLGALSPHEQSFRQGEGQLSASAALNHSLLDPHSE
eukprot:scaffold652136_cov45-Prasinocladus_malaysianus.AAC.1